MKKKLIIVVVALVAAGGAYKTVLAKPAEKEKKPKVEGQVYVMPKEFLVNLSGGRFAKFSVALVMPRDDRSERSLVGVGEHTRLPHACHADRAHRHPRRLRRRAQRLEGATPQDVRIGLGAVRADVPRRGGPAGAEHRAVLGVDHGLA